jgi:hypothetical protein
VKTISEFVDRHIATPADPVSALQDAPVDLSRVTSSAR